MNLTSFACACAAEGDDEDGWKSDKDHVDGVEPGVLIAVVDDSFEDVATSGIDDRPLEIIGFSSQGVSQAETVGDEDVVKVDGV